MERTMTVLTDVKDLGELLNGSRVDQAQLIPSGGRLQLVLDFTRAMIEQQQVIKRGPFRRLKTPWTKCRLTLKGIKSATVKRLTDLAPDQTPLLSCDAVSGGYQLIVQAPDGLQFVLSLEQLDGSFTDLGSPIDAP